MAFRSIEDEQACPCGAGRMYSDCCEIFISGQGNPSTPESLMRSRYTAYYLGDMNYISTTMKSPASDHFDENSAREWASKITWCDLKIIRTKHDALKGYVEFIASYLANGKKSILHEISEFQFVNGKWYYVDGIHPDKPSIPPIAEKIGRNDPCPCGSNKKFKKCCGHTLKQNGE